MKASDIYDENEFNALFKLAEANASGDFELEFIESIGTKYDEYGVNMFLSEKQDKVLRRIAYGD